MATLWFESATIDGFRNLRGLSLEGLGAINVLVGENNSGKTSVLEALSILANYNDTSEWLNMVARRDFGRLDETRADSIRWCFHRIRSAAGKDEYFRGDCRMECRGELGTGTLDVRCWDISGFLPRRDDPADESTDAEDNEVGTGSEPEVAEIRRGVSVTHKVAIVPQVPQQRVASDATDPFSLEVWEYETRIFSSNRATTGWTRFRTRREHTVSTETLNPYSYQINSLQTRRLSASKLERESTELVNLLREFDTKITDIQIVSIRGGRPAIYITHEKLGPAPLSVFGDALRRAVLLATTILSFEKGGILFIDEIETGIHVHTIQRVFAWLAKVAVARNVQVFVTTHSLEAVDAMVFSGPDAKDHVVAFHLDQGPDRTTAKRFDGDLLARLRRERGLDVR